MILGLARQHDTQYKASGFYEFSTFMHHVIMFGHRNNGPIDPAVLVDNVRNVIEEFSRHSSSCKKQKGAWLLSSLL